jgi:hypothetical protein
MYNFEYKNTGPEMAGLYGDETVTFFLCKPSQGYRVYPLARWEKIVD